MPVSLVIAAGQSFIGTVIDDHLVSPAAVDTLDIQIPTPRGIQLQSQRVVRPYLGLVTLERIPLPLGSVLLGPESMSAMEWDDLEKQYATYQADKHRARAERSGLVVPGIQPDNSVRG